MSGMSIEIKGLDKLIRKLGRLKAFAELRPALVRGVAMLHEAVAQYPAPPANSTYRRTGTLGRRWTTNVETLTTFRGTIGNDTLYGPYVQDAAKQARIHQNRWKTIQDVVSEKASAIVADFRAAIQRMLNE